MEKTKAAYQLDTPFSNVEWPRISQEDQDSILDLLCNLLSPIGQHRKAYIKASKGKRTKRAAKRKRGQEEKLQEERSFPPPPAVAASVHVGLSNITRNLQLGAVPSAPVTEAGEDGASATPPAPYSIIFISRVGPSSTFFSHLPQMVAVASKAQQHAEPIRLVGLSKASEERLSACIGVPRVTSLALCADDTAQLKAVEDFVRERVPAVEAPWLDEAAKGIYLETKVNTIQVPIGKKRQKKV